MTDVSAMVAELIAAGCAPEVAAKVVASAFVAGVSSATFRGIPVDESAEKRRAYDRERKRLSAEFRRKSTESAEIPISPLSKDKEEKKERGRGSRLSAEWVPDETDRAFARGLGWSNSQIDAEAANFRDYWIARPGAGGVKLDWPATWRKWVRSSKVKPMGTAGPMNDPADKIPVEQAVEIFARIRKLPRGSPINDIGQAPPELLAKYNLLVDGRRAS